MNEPNPDTNTAGSQSRRWDPHIHSPGDAQRPVWRRLGEPSARIEGQLGPVTRARTAANLPDCGTNYVVAFFLTGGDWYSPSYKIETCAESRHWVPVDPGKH